MKKNLTLFALLAVLAAPTLSFAETNNFDNSYQNSQGEPNIRISIVQELVKDLVKRSLYDLGTRVLDRYINPNNINYSPQTYTQTQQNNQSYTINPSTTTTQTTTQQNPTSNQGDYIPGQGNPPEQMIPVS